MYCDFFYSYKKMKIHLQIKHQDLSQEERASELATFSRLAGKYSKESITGTTQVRKAGG